MSNKFIPDSADEIQQEVIYFEDVRTSGGWAGQGTNKSIPILQSECDAAIVRLGGHVTNWLPGKLEGQERWGYQLEFSIPLKNGSFTKGKLSVVTLPFKTNITESKKTQAKKMALFNLRNQLEAMWRMQNLSPQYFALVPFLLSQETGLTFTEEWVTQNDAGFLLPAVIDEGEIVDGEFMETD